MIRGMDTSAAKGSTHISDFGHFHFGPGFATCEAESGNGIATLDILILVWDWVGVY